jgi:SAM-dependent methyltransferase
MNSDEYTNLDRVEALHWYYSGKRELVKAWISRTRKPIPSDVLLDCGAGTGRFAKEMEAHCRVLVLDDHEEALRLLRDRFAPDQVLSLEENRVPLPDGSLEYVTALDVLEHVPDDAQVVRGFHQLLKPGGIAVVTVPAGMALWSDWDVALHHFRRYNRSQLRALFPPSQWELVHLNYTNVVVYPAVWLIRKWRALKQRFGIIGSTSRSEDNLPPRWINRLLRAIFVTLGEVGMPFPFGVSLILVARRRA